MSGSPSWPLQQATFTRLSGDATLTTTLGAAVYDSVPTGAAYPYVVIGEDTEVPHDSMGTTGRDTTITIHTWSRYVGKKQTKEIQNRVDQLLDRWLPTVAGWNSTHMLNEYRDSFLDPDGITRHGVSRYRIHNHA